MATLIPSLGSCVSRMTSGVRRLAERLPALTRLYWSVGELRHQIEHKAFERTELAALQTPAPVRAEPVEAASGDCGFGARLGT